MKKDKDTKELDIAFERYFGGKDPVLHKQAIENLLKKVDLEEYFMELLEDGGAKDFFLMWDKVGELEKDPVDKKGLQQLGKLSKKYYEKKEYKKLHELFFDIMFKNFADIYNLQNRNDFKKITDIDLYEKNIIPSEIFFQFFLIEFPLKNKDFDWNRSEEVMKQHLACLQICFEDIYDFFNTEEE